MGQSLETAKIVNRLVREVFPLVDRELDRWRRLAWTIPDQVLRRQALASISDKKFHCQGGSVYALYPGAIPAVMIRFIVALQTISDYLDNLCDRAGCLEEEAFRQLHLAMMESVSPGTPLSDYYREYPSCDDGGYLKLLVEECRSCLGFLPGYQMVRDDVTGFVSWYSELQSLKHIHDHQRKEKMLAWTQPFLEVYPQVSAWEFAAATGSTLGIFMLCTAVCDPLLTGDKVKKIKESYFPFVCGFHILLDYFIDQQEDRQQGDLNFVCYYPNAQAVKTRLTYFLRESLARVRSLPEASFHVTVIEGMLAMYLSDAKAFLKSEEKISRELLKYAGKRTRLLHGICRCLRIKGAI